MPDPFTGEALEGAGQGDAALPLELVNVKGPAASPIGIARLIGGGLGPQEIAAELGKQGLEELAQKFAANDMSDIPHVINYVWQLDKAGFSHEEIANRAGVSATTVRDILQRLDAAGKVGDD